MADDHDIEPVPDRPDEPRIGVDEWVATHDTRSVTGSGPVARARRELKRVPTPSFYLAFAVVAAFLPAMTSSDYVVRVGFDTLLYMLLALGLNITVGYAGLLDLGYVAFYGFGAYLYAMLASPKFGLHWATLGVIVVVTIATAILGLLVALPSRRLLGDYLAIVTLFFGQFFVTVYQNGNQISVLGLTRKYDVTGGPNGIPDVDNFDFFGLKIDSVRGYYYTALIMFSLVLAVVFLIDRSRTGRAWRALREDPLAAELIGIPVNRQKLIAFSLGAAIAGMTGTLFAALNTAVFSADFDTPTLIIVYAILILGGAGSLGGVIIGALVVNVSLEILRTSGHATYIFYLAVAIGLILFVRPWRWFVAVVGGTIAFGYVAHAVIPSIWPQSDTGSAAIGGPLGAFLNSWQLYPTHPMKIGNYCFVILVFVVMGLTLLQGWKRWVALMPTIYLASFVWENRLVMEPSITRLILIGVILIVLMNMRPQGMLGTSRVEIV